MNARPVFSLHTETLQDVRIQAVSQPGLLEMLVAEGAKSGRLTFVRGAALQELRRERGRVVGVRLRTEQGDEDISADLVIGTDGRNSAVRRLAEFSLGHASPPMDIVWCKLPCPADWQGVRAYVGRGHLLVAYRTWDGTLQLGWVILKGTFGELRQRGIENWIDEMADHVSADFAEHLRQHRERVEKPFLLDTVSDCVTTWSKPGVLLTGDAAHTMSPVGGQGINIALRDAIVAANHLVPIMQTQTLDPDALSHALAVIEQERMAEVAPIQALQAQPPKLVLSRAWWGEPLRRLAGRLLRSERLRQRIGARVSIFPFGVTQVDLQV